jgi:hypothetical protein
MERTFLADTAILLGLLVPAALLVSFATVKATLVVGILSAVIGFGLFCSVSDKYEATYTAQENIFAFVSWAGVFAIIAGLVKWGLDGA